MPARHARRPRTTTDATMAATMACGLSCWPSSLFVCILATTSFAAAAPGGQPVRSASPLATLPALPKVHHSTAMEPLNASDPTLQHYLRITHSVGLTVYWADREMVFAAAAACHAADALPAVPMPAGGTAPPPANPLRCGIAANYNPWGEDGSPFPRTAPPTEVGRLEDAEMALFRSRLLNVTSWLAAANSQLNLRPLVQISALLLDSERFGVKEAGEAGAIAWNNAITRKHNLFLTAGRELLLSTVEPEYYSFGGLIRGPDGDGVGTAATAKFMISSIV